MYILELLCSYFIELHLFGACARSKMKSVKFNGESQSKSSCTSDNKMEIFPWLSNIYRWRIYRWNVRADPPYTQNTQAV